ncbi:YrhA family protein [Enterobacter ludwigii]|uniref:YrhA family protein n=1 Tax=Enterobacterales TaxID=91347 RepID=UPI000E0E229D|nr:MULTISPECIES: YrhA family protein [Enterobacterales]MCF8579230.1 YrhA family protein [Enterobacter ludwigii]NJQ21538.1 hypothetical protein [Pantoea sp. LS15]NKF48134.1 hypothetical protein [Pantoea sp. LS15]RDK13161.1 hypothetical protein CEJ32_18500 [Enterobacter sp. 9-2]
MKIENILAELKSEMIKWEYPVQDPIGKSFLNSILNRKPDSTTTPMLENLADELCVLFSNQPDYITFLEYMDGFEYDGLTLFSLSIPEPLVKNLFVMNDFYRDNDDFIDPDLAERLVIGENSISLFTYDTKFNLFEIRDNVSTESVFGTFDNFSDFLKEILETVK